ncbi:SMI1/KNR4 family protein [Nonomuraea jabiensis]|uniref:Knr4/Smi1-like domain-containing protein n=1 Tax=Nonomuraea jabiensis TaxID=882448 RepID=A0A7W9LGZ6_9ACTN|nr:SMI1/KNR4 family protein [Nonomuraea jabiensis]MBB5783476.1 hypothetical protein [Nonomuraea jabiensis]
MRSDISLDEMATGLSRLADLSTAVPLPESEVVALEEVIGAPLPDEFRSFLLRFGRGVSPGPLLDLRWIVEETQGEREHFQEEPEVAAYPWEPFPVTRDDVRQLRRLAAEGADPTLWMDKPSPGTMFLCSHGCSWISMLAMNGEYAGTVWLTEWGEAKDMYWWPSAPWRDVEPSGRLHGGWSEPVPFLDWYMRWTQQRVSRRPLSRQPDLP